MYRHDENNNNTNNNNKNNNNAINESMGISLYEYWLRNYQAVIPAITTKFNTPPPPTTQQQQQQQISDNYNAAFLLKQQIQMQYQAMLYAMQEMEIVDPINLFILQQQQQQQQRLFYPPNDDSISVLNPTPPTLTNTNLTTTELLPPYGYDFDIADHQQLVDDFFQEYPNARSNYSPIPTKVRERSSDATLRPSTTNRYTSTKKRNEEHNSGVIMEAGRVTIPYPSVQPQRTKTTTRHRKENETNHRLPSRQQQRQRHHNDDMEPPPFQQRENHLENSTNHSNGSKQPRENSQSYASDYDENRSDPPPRRRRRTKRPPNSTNSDHIVNPFQTAREVAETHVFYDDEEEEDGDGNDRHHHESVPTSRNINSNTNNHGDIMIVENRPVSNTNQAHSTIHVNNPYQPPIVPPPMIRESLKRKFQPPVKRSSTTSRTEIDTTSVRITSNDAPRRSKKTVSSETCIGVTAAAAVPSTRNTSKSTIRASAQTTTATTSHHHNNNTRRDNDDDDELPEELRIYGKDLVEKIENEIMEDRGGSTTTTPITFDDIAGLKDQKQTVYEVVCWPMQRPDLFTGLRRAPNGLLLYGPPGTGTYTLIGEGRGWTV
jgi:hypothetical protein